MRKLSVVFWTALLAGTGYCLRASDSGAPVTAEPGEELSGGTATVFQDGQNAFSLPLANISRMNGRAHVIGNSFFNKNWVVAPASPEGRDGLGPLFLARSCSACHLRDGRGLLSREPGAIPGVLLRLSVPGEDENGAPLPDPVFGNQLTVQAIPGAEPEAEVRIDFEETKGRYEDGTEYTLRRPIFSVKPSAAYGTALTPGLQISPRLSPPVYGLGLLEAIPEKTIREWSDPEDFNEDGISGRPNYVWNPEVRERQLGRFGWKANQPDIRQQTAAAFVGDIGITSSIFPEEDLSPVQASRLRDLPSGGSPELEEKVLDRIVRYLQTLAPPARRNPNAPEVLRGKGLFHAARCAGCHLPKIETGDHPEVPELSNQVIRPFTDLLLHDMGEDLADNRPDFEATGSEWRTPPLWGIGLNRAVNGHENYLHDGRARNLEEAILWHGGEAGPSREVFRNLKETDRLALIAFLESL